MSRFFDLDGPVMKFLNKVADLMILNIFTLLGCIPLITAGASITAMHYVLLKMARGEEAYIVKDWWKSFKQNFRQATVIWLIILVVAGFLATDYYIYLKSGIAFPKAMVILTGVAAIVIFVIYLYVFPVLSHFSNTIKYTLRNAFLMSILGFPRTIGMAIVTAIPIVFIFFVPVSTVYKMVPIYIMFGFSLPGYACAYLYSPLFKRFEPKTDENKKEDALSEDDYREVVDILKADDVLETEDTDAETKASVGTSKETEAVTSKETEAGDTQE